MRFAFPPYELMRLSQQAARLWRPRNLFLYLRIAHFFSERLSSRRAGK